MIRTRADLQGQPFGQINLITSMKAAVTLKAGGPKVIDIREKSKQILKKG